MLNEVIAFITECGTKGATCEEVARALEIPGNTASARVSELVNLKGRLVASGERRPTVTGALARVYVLAPVAATPQTRDKATPAAILLLHPAQGRALGRS